MDDTHFPQHIHQPSDRRTQHRLMEQEPAKHDDAARPSRDYYDVHAAASSGGAGLRAYGLVRKTGAHIHTCWSVRRMIVHI